MDHLDKIAAHILARLVSMEIYNLQNLKVSEVPERTTRMTGAQMGLESYLATLTDTQQYLLGIVKGQVA